MVSIRVFSVTGLGILAGTALLVTLTGCNSGPEPQQNPPSSDKGKKKGGTSGADQPIIISDGSLFIHTKDETSLNTWIYSGVAVLPSTLSPPVTPAYKWGGADVADGGGSPNNLCASSDTSCTIDITYYYAKPSLHVTLAGGVVTITSDNDPFDAWLGFQDYLMYHPRPPSKILAVASSDNYSGTYSSGKVKVTIHLTR